jgi:hypothetical protein
MARFKPYSYDQLKLVPVSFERQILPGTFEATLSRLIDEEIDLSVFEARYRSRTDDARRIRKDEAGRVGARDEVNPGSP